MKKFVKRVLSIVLAAAVLATSVTLPQTAQDVQAASSKAWKKSGGKCYNGKGQVIPGAKTRGNRCLRMAGKHRLGQGRKIWCGLCIYPGGRLWKWKLSKGGQDLQSEYQRG